MGLSVCLRGAALPPELEADGLWRAQCQVWVTGAERQGQPQPDETLLFLPGCSTLRIRQPEMGLGAGAASEAALLLRGWKRSRDSQGRSRPASKQPGRETPRWINKSRHLVRSRHRRNQGGFGTSFDTARISLAISSVQPVWGGCSLRKAAGTRLQKRA